MRPIRVGMRLTALCLVLLLSTLCGCQSERSISWASLYTQAPSTMVQPEQSPSDRDVLRVTMPLSSGIIDPAVNTSQAMQGLMQLVYEAPVRLDSALKPQEQLVSWTSSADGRVWTFSVRQGVYFQDGSPLTAQDIVRSLDRILTVGEEGPYAWILDQLLSWSAPDESTLIVTSARGGYSTLYAMVFPVIKQQGEGYPIGTGPFRIASYVQGESMELIQQDHWWRNPPHFKRISAVARESSDSELASLGDIDILQTRSVASTQYGDIGITDTYDYMTQGYDALFFNFRKPMMADLAIRKAIAGAIDRQDIIANIYQNHAIASEVCVPPISWLHEVRSSASVAGTTSPWQALEDMGFVDVDGDGLFDLIPEKFRKVELPDEEEEAQEAPMALNGGEEEDDTEADELLAELMTETQLDPAARSALMQELTILTNYNQENPVRRDAALRIVDQLRAAGLIVEVVSAPLDKLGELIEAGEYDMALLGYQVPLSNNLDFLLSSQYQGEQSGHSVTGFSDPLLDSLLAQLYGARDDAAYRAGVREIADRTLALLPYVGLYFRTGTIATRENLRISASMHESAPYAGIENWHFVTQPE